MALSSNRDVEVAVRFHDATKHSYTSVRTGGFALDWNNRPMPYKIYPGAGTLALPRELDLPQVPTLSALREPQPAPAAALDLETVTRLLFCCDGLTRRASVGGEDYHFRAAASAGALYPVELYLAAAEVDGMESGLYHFLPADLKLHGLRRGDCRSYLAEHTSMPDAIRRARAVLFMTSIFWRSAWKYRARAYRYCFWDSGTILANLIATANAEPLPVTVVTTFEDVAIETLLGVDCDREGVTCLVAVGQTESCANESQKPGPLELESIPLSHSEVVYDELVSIQRASRLSSEEMAEIAGVQLEPRAAEKSAEVIRLDAAETETGMGLGETILRRGSTRVFAQDALATDELAAILQSSKISLNKDFPFQAEIYLIVNAVDGIEPGAYYYQRDTDGLELLKQGNFRNEAGYLCLEQPLGADCSALIVYMADLERSLDALGNRGYRDIHLEAGLLGGRAYLTAYCQGRGATGLTFYDDDTTGFFQPHCGKMSPLLMVAVGVPRPRRSEEEE